MLRPRRYMVGDHPPLICLQRLYWEKWKGAKRTMTLAMFTELSTVSLDLLPGSPVSSFSPPVVTRWPVILTTLLFVSTWRCPFLMLYAPCPFTPRALPTIPMAFRLCSQFLVSHRPVSSPCPTQHKALVPCSTFCSSSHWVFEAFVFALLICSTWTQGPTMRGSVTDLILATNTSHIILYEDDIEGETFGH